MIRTCQRKDMNKTGEDQRQRQVEAEVQKEAVKEQQSKQVVEGQE